MTDSHDGGTEPRQHDLPADLMEFLGQMLTIPAMEMVKRSVRSHAAACHADQMRKLREAQGLSDERIVENLRDCPVRENDHGDAIAFAHAIADPLLARIETYRECALGSDKIVEEQAERIEELEAQVRHWQDRSDTYRDERDAAQEQAGDMQLMANEMEQENIALRTQLAEAQKDAERYRWLRGDDCANEDEIFARSNVYNGNYGDYLDREIDAALTPKETT
jgi:chromosome segregation ATPase